MIAAEIAAALGGHRAGGWWSCRCPAHDDRKADRCHCATATAALIVRCWAGCDPRDVLAALRRLGLLGGGDTIHAAPIAKRRDGDDDTRRRGSRRRGASGRPRERRQDRRWRTISPAAAASPSLRPRSLRYAPSLRRPDGTYGPAMVARIDRYDGELIGMHRDLARSRTGRRMAAPGPGHR